MGVSTLGANSELGQAALEQAAGGHPTLPLHTPGLFGCSCGRDCGASGKHPRGVHGLSHATTNLEQVDAWWHMQPQANIGLRTDGLAVFDVDGTQGERWLEFLQGRLGELPETREQASGRGRHLLYAVPDDASIGNSTRGLGDPSGLHVRAGAKGYIVAPPSRHASGRRYRLLRDCEPAPLPLSWLERLERPLRLVSPSSDASVSRTTRYGRAALEDELAQLRQAQDGARNNALNARVFRLAQLVAEHRLARRELEENAFAVALAIGLTPVESERTIRSAIKAGLHSPRS